MKRLRLDIIVIEMSQYMTSPVAELMGGVQAAPPDKLNVKTGPPLVDILIFSFL